MLDTPQLETKAAAADVSHAIDGLMHAFEEFKATNDRRLDELETRLSVDVVTTDKLARIDRALDEHKRTVDQLSAKATRLPIGGEPRAAHQPQVKAAFDGYVRRGDSGALASLDRKSLSISTNADGGYLVPDETERAVNAALRDISPIRAIAGIRQVSGSVFKKPFSTTGFGTGWVGETASRPETTTSTIAELAFPTMELYAMPAATQALLDDAAVDIDQWIADEVRAAFAEQEGTAFVTGNGVARPKGFLDYTKVADGSWSWGNIGFLATGAAGAFPAANPGDKLVDLVYAVKATYRANSHFVMSRATQSAARKLKDGDGTYLWQPSLSPGETATLMGFPVIEAEDMPDIATDAFAVAFGDFRRGYLIVDRVGIRVLRDPYSAKPYVLFYTTKRVGGGVQDFDAIKLLKFGV